MRKLSKGWKWTILISFTVTAGVILYGYMGQYKRCVVKDGYILVPTGATFQTLTDSLTKGEYIANMSVFKQYANIAGLNQRVTAGRYQMETGMRYKQVINMLRGGMQKPVRVTFNNIRTIDRLAGALSRTIEPDSLTLVSVFYNDTTAKYYGFSKETFISMFIPNTYEFYWNTSVTKFMDKMKKEYDLFWNKERMEKLNAIGLNRQQAATLASIVYEETKVGDEMPMVAGVYINRLRINMPLQADPTVKFAVGDPTIKRVLNRHLEVDSPYNTYKYSGLPPGPICMPSIKAIDAVLNYKAHNYIYFCAKSDFSGRHVFAATLAQHNRNAREYANALNSKKIFR